MNKEIVIDKEILQQACKHPLWFEFSQEITEDEVYKDVKCVVCEYEKTAEHIEFNYNLNPITGLYETNIISINDLDVADFLKEDEIFQIVKAEFEKFARQYEKDNNNNKVNIGEETVKEFKKNYRR